MLRNLNASAGGRRILGTPYVGLLAEQIAAETASGSDGPGLLYNEAVAPENSGKRLRLRVSSWPATGALIVAENGAYEWSGLPDGTHTLTYEVFVDGVSQGEASLVITVGSAANAPGAALNAAASISGGTATGGSAAFAPGAALGATAAIAAGAATGSSLANAPGATLSASVTISPGVASAFTGGVPVEALIYQTLGGIVSNRVFPDVAPFNTPRPYIIYQQIGGRVINPLGNEQPEKQNGFFQISAWSDSRATTAAIMLQIETAMRGASVFVASPQSAPIAEHEPDLNRYGASQDFSVWSDR